MLWVRIVIGCSVGVAVLLARRIRSRKFVAPTVPPPPDVERVKLNMLAAGTAPLAPAPERTPWFSALIFQGLDSSASLRINGRAYGTGRQSEMEGSGADTDEDPFRGFSSVPPGLHELTIVQGENTLTFELPVEAGMLYVRSYDAATNTVRGKESSINTPRAAELVRQLTKADALQCWPVRTVYIVDATADISVNGQAIKAAPFIAVTNLGGQACLVRHGGVALSVPRANEGSTVLTIETGPVIRHLARLRGNIVVEYSERAYGWPAMYRADGTGHIELIDVPS